MRKQWFVQSILLIFLISFIALGVKYISILKKKDSINGVITTCDSVTPVAGEWVKDKVKSGSKR